MLERAQRATATLILQCILGLSRNESRDCMPEFARYAMPCGLGSEVHSAFLRAVELQSSDCRRTPSATERMLG